MTSQASLEAEFETLREAWQSLAVSLAEFRVTFLVETIALETIALAELRWPFETLREAIAGRVGFDLTFAAVAGPQP